MDSVIVKNEKVFGPYYHMEVEAGGIGRGARPGMFYMLKVGNSTDPLLRRPLSLHSMVSADRIRFLYKDAGKGTSLLAKLKPGDALDALGPLGNGFTVGKNVKRALIVAGGIGVAPLLGLAEHIITHRPDIKVVSFIGGRGGEDLLAVREMSGLGVRTHLCTEDGSFARCGIVTDTLGDYINKFAPGGTSGWAAYSCGPRGMMKAVSSLCADSGIRSYVSLESHMACGIGACMGCVTSILVDGKPANRLVCKDGPVFPAEKVVW
jgi:dihydroorotate dehydrogenase electron transfer subunit